MQIGVSFAPFSIQQIPKHAFNFPNWTTKLHFYPTSIFSGGVAAAVNGGDVHAMISSLGISAGLFLFVTPALHSLVQDHFRGEFVSCLCS